MDFVLIPQLKFIVSFFPRLRSTHTGIPKTVPNGETAPDKHPVTECISSGVANLKFLQLITFLNCFEEKRVEALNTAR